MSRKVHFIASGTPERGVTTSCLKTSAGGGRGRQIFTFAERRRSMSDPVRDFEATSFAPVVTCARCLAHLTTQGQS